MNIALVIFRAEVHRGGAERYVNDLCIALKDRGHRVTILASSGEAPEGVAFVRINASGLTRKSKYLRFCSNVEQHIQANGYDIVHSCLPIRACDVYHAHSGIESLSLRDGPLKHSALAKQVVTRFSNQLNGKRKAFAEMEASMLQSALPPVVLCLSNRERDEARLMFPAARDQFVTLYSFPNDARFSLNDVAAIRKRTRKQLSLSGTQTMFLFIGNDFERKGLTTAIRAIGLMKDPCCMLYVVGEGDTRRYSNIALRCGAVGRVMFLGQSDNIRDLLAAADALVLPTRSEPFGMVVVEAVLMGVPPIVSNVAGASEIIEDGRNGYVMNDPDDAGAWSETMTRLTEPSLRESLSRVCLEQRERFSYENHLKALETIYSARKSRKNA